MTNSQGVSALKAELKKSVQNHVKKTSEKPIRLASGAETHEYYDGKQVTLYPERAVCFARLALKMISIKDFDAVGGMSIGADPVASAISLVAFLDQGLKVPVFLVRRESKTHGLQKKIEGPELKKGMKVLIVEDVVTQGNSTLRAIEAVEATGAEVGQILCLVDREAGGAQALSSKYKFTAIFKKSEL